MGKNKKMSQAEMWDDSALVDSWNEALEEYKRYHSIAAKGEKIEVLLDNAERRGSEATVETSNEDRPAGSNVETNGSSADLAAAQSAIATGQPTLPGSEGLPEAATVPSATNTEIPQMLLNTMQDEGMKNIMMSWYYAGYYTGLHEGQQKAYAAMHSAT